MFPSNVATIITEYDPIYERVLEWVTDTSPEINWHFFSLNRKVPLNLLEENIDKFCSDTFPNMCPELSTNPKAVPFLEKNPHLIHWRYLSGNSEARDLLKTADPKKLDWWRISDNSGAIELIEKELLEPDSRVDWWNLSSNPGAIKILEKNPDKIDWGRLSFNPNGIDLIRTKMLNPNFGLNETELYYSSLWVNQNALDLLREFRIKPDWEKLCYNPNGIDMLGKRIEEFRSRGKRYFDAGIDLTNISGNSNAGNLIEKIYDDLDGGVDKGIDGEYTWNRLVFTLISLFENNITFLEKHPECIDKNFIWENSGIFVEDFNQEMFDTLMEL